MMQKLDFTFFHPLRVRWNECDAQGIVFNANYPLYFDIGVWEYTRALGYTLEDAPEFLTARLECDFRAPAKFDDALEVGVRVARLGGKSCQLAFCALRGDDLIAEGANTYVAVERGSTSTMPLDREYVSRVLAFERKPPASKET